MKQAASYIREFFSYIERFRGHRFVIRIDDELLVPEAAAALAGDLARIRRAGVGLFIVVGARQRIDTVLRQYGRSWEMVGGVRVSEASDMSLIEMAAFDVATRVMTLMTGEGAEAVIGNWVRARTLGVVDGVDFQRTGQVDSVDTIHIERLMNDGVIPILPCIGWNRRGRSYNLSSGRLACELAKAQQALKLIYFDSSAINLPPRLTPGEAKDLLAQGSLRQKELELLGYSIDAVEGGVSRVHLLTNTEEDALLIELFTNMGAGAMIYSEEYESVRNLRREDIPAVLQLSKPHVESGRLLNRDEGYFESRVDEIFVYEIDGTVHGVAGLRVYDGTIGEVYGLAVDAAVSDLGVGKRLVLRIIDAARSKGVSQLLACTTQAFDWFHELGFEQTTYESLPRARRLEYDVERNSLVVTLDLGSPQ